MLPALDSLAVAPEGGLIVAMHNGSGSVLAMLRADGSPGWTALVGGRGFDVNGTMLVSANSSHFLAAGCSGPNYDLDPGPDLVEPAAYTSFVARYRY